jgi:hypothetical protein
MKLASGRKKVLIVSQFGFIKVFRRLKPNVKAALPNEFTKTNCETLLLILIVD